MKIDYIIFYTVGFFWGKYDLQIKQFINKLILRFKQRVKENKIEKDKWEREW